MSSLVLCVRCHNNARPSSLGWLAMACLRKGMHNLSRSSGTSTSMSRSFTSSTVLSRHITTTIHSFNDSYGREFCSPPCQVHLAGFPAVVRTVVGVGSFMRSPNVLIRRNGCRRTNNGVADRFHFTKGEIFRRKDSPGLEVRRPDSVGEGLMSRQNCVVTTSTTLDLSLESNFGQVSGDLEQEYEEDASGESFPRGTYESSPQDPSEAAAAHACVGHEPSAHHAREQDGIITGAVHPAVTITEVLDEGFMAELEDALGFPLCHRPQGPTPKPLVIVISGPSGVGKDAVIRKLQHIRGDIHFVVTATTRPKRPNEIDGVDYHFMSKSEFQEMIENHELLEHAMVYGDYKGIPKQQVREFMSQGMDVVLRVDVQGAATVRSILGSEAVFIFLVAESEVGLVKRLIERKTETMDKMLVRVATAREELIRMDEFDYVVVNREGCLDKTVSLICSIIDAEKARVKPKAAEI